MNLSSIFENFVKDFLFQPWLPMQFQMFIMCYSLTCVTISSFIFWELPEMVPILFYCCIRRQSHHYIMMMILLVPDYNNWIPITYPTTFTMILLVQIIITGFLLHTLHHFHSLPCLVTGLFVGFANWGNGSGSFTSVWFGWGSCHWGLLPPS